MAKLEVDGNLIRTLAALLEETGLSEIELGEGDKRIRVARGAPAAAAPPPRQAAPAPASADEAPEAQEGGPAPSSHVDPEHPGVVTSPMVGTVYLAPEAGAPPLINVGDTVEEGATLLIVEAMKTMNPIRSPKAGKVAELLVENGAPVEYGEVLLILE
ncbi:MAG: acetyl-CoA carboxylase biotin carboxyl carrier protein [Alphaproteobacteria bacterium]